jgi:trigger factor
MINVEMQEKEENKRILNVTIPAEEVDQQFVAVTAKVREAATLPGFRKGKVPLDIVTKNYSQEIHQEVLDQLFSKSYQQALQETKSVPIQKPKLEKIDLTKGKPMSYQVLIEVLPKVKLGNYKGLKLKAPKIVVTDADVNQVLENLRQQSAILEPVTGRPSRKGDIVTLDFSGTKDGIPVPGVKAEGYNLELGAGQTIEDFEKNLEGVAEAETKVFDGHFPEDYHAKEIAGQTIAFKATVKSIREKKLPEVNDEFAKEVGNFTSLDELKNRVKQDLEKEKEKNNRILLSDQVMKELSKTTQVKVPEVLVERSLDNLVHDYEERMVRQKTTWAEMGMTADELKKKNHEIVENELKARLALSEIADVEKIEPAEEDVNEEVTRLAQASRQRPEVVRNYLNKTDNWDELRDRVKGNKTVDFIIAQAKISES